MGDGRGFRTGIKLRMSGHRLLQKETGIYLVQRQSLVCLNGVYVTDGSAHREVLLPSLCTLRLTSNVSSIDVRYQPRSNILNVSLIKTPLRSNPNHDTQSGGLSQLAM